MAIGQTGAGKTTLFYNVMDQLSVPYWVFDLKQDYRHLCQQDNELLVVPWTELKWNPLEPPPGVSLRRWAQVFSEMLGHATALLSGSKNYLMRQMIELYRAYGLFDRRKPPYPSLHELQQFIETDKINYVRKTANYRDTVLNRLEAMTLTAGTIFDCSEGYPVEELLKQNVVFEFDGLGTDLQNFLMETLFAAVYEYRVAQNQRGGSLRHVFFLDEGKQVFSVYKERQDAAGLPAVDMLTAKMREFGEGLVVADQEATKLTDSIKANTKTTVLLATGDATQFQDIAATMALSDRQASIAQRLGTGEAIVQTGNREPCPVRLDNYELEKTVSDTRLRKIQQAKWNALSWTPRDRPDTFLQEATPTDGESTEPVIPDESQPDIALSDAADHLLTDVVERPFAFLTERYDRFDNVYQGNKAKNELIETGLADEQPVTVDGGVHKLLELTEQGIDYAKTVLELDPTHRGRGGIVHRYWQHRLVQLFEDAGWTAKRELFDADVYVNMAETELVIEVAMGNNQREVDHVQQHLAEGFDAVWVLCRDTTVKTALEQRLADQDLLDERVVVRTVSEVCSGENTAI
ncbi:hypothetical protein QA600_18605 [Natronococcus sp. A-GB1]|uniref:ATP-binding protein n=1 Tax=Natronococcus sp. A-GB1 TaxID=3037648 RepID=UPI00241C484C|nr:hypothetical protein [Natronococcus sp. A-GB1]MDG5761345.1 hypothetical protein [Natronococcus sp. A-GB1]